MFLFQDVSYHGDSFLYIQNTEVCSRIWVNMQILFLYDRALPTDALSQTDMTINV